MFVLGGYTVPERVQLLGGRRESILQLGHCPSCGVGRVVSSRDESVIVLESIVIMDLSNSSVERLLVELGLLPPPFTRSVIGTDVDGSSKEGDGRSLDVDVVGIMIADSL